MLKVEKKEPERVEEAEEKKPPWRVARPPAVKVLKVAPLVAFSCEPMVVEPVMASVVPVALVKSVEPKSVVEASSA